MELHRKAVDGESLLSGEVDQAPLPGEEDQSQCCLLPFPPQRKRRLWMDESFERAAYETGCKKVEDLDVHR